MRQQWEKRQALNAGAQTAAGTAGGLLIERGAERGAAPAAEMRATERQAAEELGQWMERREENGKLPQGAHPGLKELHDIWDRGRRLIDARARDLADIPGGNTGLLVRDYKGRQARL